MIQEMCVCMRHPQTLMDVKLYQFPTVIIYKWCNSLEQNCVDTMLKDVIRMHALTAGRTTINHILLEWSVIFRWCCIKIDILLMRSISFDIDLWPVHLNIDMLFPFLSLSSNQPTNMVDVKRYQYILRIRDDHKRWSAI